MREVAEKYRIYDPERFMGIYLQYTIYETLLLSSEAASHSNNKKKTSTSKF